MSVTNPADDRHLKPIESPHDVAWITPDGDRYAAHWDPVARHVVVMLVEPGDRKANAGQLCVTPQSSNVIQLYPRPRSSR